MKDFLPVLRHALQAVSGALMLLGYVDEAHAEMLSGALLSLATVGWWWWSKKAGPVAADPMDDVQEGL